MFSEMKKLSLSHLLMNLSVKFFGHGEKEEVQIVVSLSVDRLLNNYWRNSQLK